MKGFLCGAVPDHFRVESSGNFLFNSIERSTTDEEDVLGVDGDHFLVRMLASTLGRNIDHRTFEQFQQSLLNPFAADIAGNGGVVALARNFVDLIDEHDAAFSRCHIVIGDLKQTGQNAFNIFSHITGFGQNSGIHDGEWHMQLPGYRFG